jgi:hypothetical protein
MRFFQADGFILDSACTAWSMEPGRENSFSNTQTPMTSARQDHGQASQCYRPVYADFLVQACPAEYRPNA